MLLREGFEFLTIFTIRALNSVALFSERFLHADSVATTMSFTGKASGLTAKFLTH